MKEEFANMLIIINYTLEKSALKENRELRNN